MEKDWMKQRFDQELALTKMEVQRQTLQTVTSDIHDNVGQLLSITKITLAAIDIDENPTKAKERLSGAIGLLDNSIKELRQLAAILHEPNILAGGLEKAVENELNWLAKTDKFEIKWSVTGEHTRHMDPQKQLIAFRVIQELLNNIIKHSDATILAAEMRYEESMVSVRVTDNGKGFDLTESLKNRRGLGIGNFFTRAEVIGGRFEMASSPGEGTKATLQIPYA